MNAQDAVISLTSGRAPLLSDIKKIDERFKFISFFAGGGGSSTGYRIAGGKTLLVNEFVPEAIKTYKSNYPDTLVLPDDIRKLTPEEILEKAGIEEGELDLLDGSPPCSAFSTLGSREKGWGETKKYSDVQQSNVEDLFFEYIRMLRGIKPKTFVAENVAGLVRGKAKGYFNEIIRELRASGYHVEAKVLDAKYLNVPQQRNRLIFVGVRDDLYTPDMKGRLHPRPVNNIITASEAFKGLAFTEQDRKETDMGNTMTAQRTRETLPGKAHHKRFSLLKLHPEQVSQCFVATNDVNSNGLKHWDNRALTISEIKRIASLPDDYILTGTYGQKAERAGRMVPPNMMAMIADNLYKQVISRWK